MSVKQSHTLEEENKCLVFKNKVIMKISEPKKAELSEHFWIVHNKELHNLYRSHSNIREKARVNIKMSLCLSTTP
jgi:hypothetical protein